MNGRGYRHGGFLIPVEGRLDGVMVRRTLDRRDWEAAQMLVREWEAYGIKEVVLLWDAYELVSST
jgi:hypothetical protein